MNKATANPKANAFLSAFHPNSDISPLSKFNNQEPKFFIFLIKLVVETPLTRFIVLT